MRLTIQEDFSLEVALHELVFPPVGQRILCQKVMLDTRFYGQVRFRHCKNPAVTHHLGRLYCRMHNPQRDAPRERSDPRRGRGPYY